MVNRRFGFYEFFAGGGMVRLGLGRRWKCLFANDNSPKKANAYRQNFRASNEFLCEDIAKLRINDLPGTPILSWASFPCQDLSLAGVRNGLSGARSGTFWPFWNLMTELSDRGTPVPIIILENVTGAITSNHGKDFQSLIETLTSQGYRVGPFVMDAVHFVPQSRPRLFIAAVRENLSWPKPVIGESSNGSWHPKSLQQAYARLNKRLKDKWMWMDFPVPPARKIELSDVLEDDPPDVVWHTAEETQKLLDMMSEPNRDKVNNAIRNKKRAIGTIYRRTRQDCNGNNVQRAEVRFDQISGCLRTPAGGSSRQIVIVVEANRIRTRLLSSREAARLMGAPESYKLPDNYNEAYHLFGDGVAVPVVTWIEKHLLSPLIRENKDLLEIA